MGAELTTLHGAPNFQGLRDGQLLITMFSLIFQGVSYYSMVTQIHPSYPTVAAKDTRRMLTPILLPSELALPQIDETQACSSITMLTQIPWR